MIILTGRSISKYAWRTFRSYSVSFAWLKVQLSYDSIRALFALLVDHQVLMHLSNFYFLCQLCSYTAQWALHGVAQHNFHITGPCTLKCFVALTAPSNAALQHFPQIYSDVILNFLVMIAFICIMDFVIALLKQYWTIRNIYCPPGNYLNNVATNVLTGHLSILNEKQEK